MRGHGGQAEVGRETGQAAENVAEALAQRDPAGKMAEAVTGQQGIPMGEAGVEGEGGANGKAEAGQLNAGQAARCGVRGTAIARTRKKTLGKRGEEFFQPAIHALHQADGEHEKQTKKAGQGADDAVESGFNRVAAAKTQRAQS